MVMGKNDAGEGGGFVKFSETLLLITGIVLFLFLSYSLLPIMSPFVLLASIAFLLYPLRHILFVRRIVWLALLLFLVWLFTNLLGALTPFIIAILLAYIFNPVVTLLERKGLRRWITTLLLIVVVLGSMAAFLILAIPAILNQSGSIIAEVSIFMRGILTYLHDNQVGDFLARLGLPADQIQNYLSKDVPSRLEELLKSVLVAVFGFLSNASSMISQLLNFVLVPFITFYLLKDFPLILKECSSVLPERSSESIREYFSRIDDVLGSYLRGTLIVAAIQGALTTAGLLLLGIQYAVVLGILTGILNLIPYVGFYTSLVFAVIAAFLSGDPVVWKVISVIVLYVAVNFIETTVWSPKIVGSKIGLHPVVMILSFVVFGYFLGFVGLIVAIPATALLVLSVRMWKEKHPQEPTTLPA
jgi:predicted PurR-regulated permease PerM